MVTFQCDHTVIKYGLKTSYSYVSWIYNYLCKQRTRYNISDKSCYKSAVFVSTNKTDSHDVTEILMNVALNNRTNESYKTTNCCKNYIYIDIPTVGLVVPSCSNKYYFTSYVKIRPFSSFTYVAIFLKWHRYAGQFQWQFCYLRNNRVPGQFTMCENVP